MNKKEFDIKFNEAVDDTKNKDVVTDSHCIMVVGDMSVGMSRKTYDEIMESAIKEVLKNRKDDDNRPHGLTHR